MSYEYKTKDTCSTKINFDKDENGSVVPNASTVHHLTAIYKVRENFLSVASGF